MAYGRKVLRVAMGVSSLAVSMGLASAASAQDAQDAPPAPPAAADAQPSIVVTGSRIATGFNAPTPVTVIGAERLAERASANIGEALNELPAFRGTQTPASTGLTPN